MIKEEAQLQLFPPSSGVYLFKNKRGVILYIGKAKNLSKRVSQYFSPGSVRKQEMVMEADKVEFITTGSEAGALYLEENLIKQHKPEYNRLLRNNSQYVYIKITHEVFPQIFLVRKRRNDKAIYIGPKHNSKALKKLLAYCKEYFQRRGCKTAQFRQGKVCYEFHFKTCKGRCVRNKKEKPAGLEDEQISPDVYKDIIKSISSFFKGKTKELKDKIFADIQNCIETQNFERAQQLKSIYTSIDGFIEKQNVVLEKPIDCTLSYVTCVQDRYVFCLVTIIDGKIIDIVREKKSTHDIQITGLMLALEQEANCTFDRYIPESFQQPLQRESLLQTEASTFPLVGFCAPTGKLTKKLWGHIAPTIDRTIQSFISSDSLESQSVMNSLLQTIQTRYGLMSYPYRIECIDISHLSGGRISGGLSCMVGGIPYPKGYRQYKIGKLTGKAKNDDYANLKEIIIRRFKLTKNQTDIDVSISSMLPDVFILDGGKGQIGILETIQKEFPFFEQIRQTVDFIALGKGEARQTASIGNASRRDNQHDIAETIYKQHSERGLLEKKLIYDEADQLIVRCRNEAHRFANRYRKKQMSQERK